MLPDAVVAALSQELSGETAKSNLEYIARFHRAARALSFAAEHIVKQLRDYGLTDARIEQFPADGKIFYGTQSRGNHGTPSLPNFGNSVKAMGQCTRVWRVGTRCRSLSLRTASGEATAELVDVNNGTSESDYANKDVRGKIVLAAAQPGAVARLAVERFGAAGIVSYAQNQRTAWFGENENLVRWGHLETFAAKPAFAFMISLKQARNFQTRLARGEKDSTARDRARRQARRIL